MVARERDQGGMALHPMTLRRSVVRAVLGELTRDPDSELRDAYRDALRAGPWIRILDS
jgi:hypothetical protein